MLLSSLLLWVLAIAALSHDVPQPSAHPMQSASPRALSRANPRADTVDVLIAGGLVHDGSGARARVADIALRGDRILFVGTTPAATVVRQRIDARGLIVAPGFIDPHTHAYEGLPRLGAERRQNLSS